MGRGILDFPLIRPILACLGYHLCLKYQWNDGKLNAQTFSETYKSLHELVDEQMLLILGKKLVLQFSIESHSLWGFSLGIKKPKYCGPLGTTNHSSMFHCYVMYNSTIVPHRTQCIGLSRFGCRHIGLVPRIGMGLIFGRLQAQKSLP